MAVAFFSVLFFFFLFLFWGQGLSTRKARAGLELVTGRVLLCCTPVIPKMDNIYLTPSSSQTLKDGSKRSYQNSASGYKTLVSSTPLLLRSSLNT